MRIGLIDVDGHNFPNLPLMKISAWFKAQKEHVEWYSPMFSGHLDKVYMSKVFGFTPEYPYYIDADEIIKGGSGYCIERSPEGGEIYNYERDAELLPAIEHIYPDYSLYPSFTEDTAYGFLSRGCPRGCKFCHVAAKEGRCSRKVADLDEFWRGQRNIVLCDPNIIACKDWKDLLQQLIDSKADVNINQGIDIRAMTAEKAEMIKKLRCKIVHFAWDRYEDRDVIVPKFKEFKEITGWYRQKMVVYVLTNYDTSEEQDLERIYTLRELGYDPYVMIYRKEDTERGDRVRKVQRWVNNRKIFNTIRRFEEYDTRY